VVLKRCWLTVAFVPRSAESVQAAASDPLDLSQTFYGPDPLVGIWGMSCERAVTGARRLDDVIVSMVAIPDGLTSEGALPVANNFAHSLVRIDTDRRALGRTLRRRGLPARVEADARLVHSSPGAVPSSGELRVPSVYRIAVSAAALDPTNPHDHLNTFRFFDRPRGFVTLGLTAEDAHDRFCFPQVGACSVEVRAHRRSPLRELLGDGSAPVTGGFDHEPLGRIELGVTDG
jgi:hypothetical protein